MKKIVIAASTLLMFSCKKEYTCECKGSVSMFEGNTNTYFKPYKKNYILKERGNKAEKICKNKEVLDVTDYYDTKTVNVAKCELK